MPRDTSSGKRLEDKVEALSKSLGLECKRSVRLGNRIWGRKRVIDIVITNGDRTKRIGVECKFQSQSGTAEEKIVAVIQDMAAWPIPGIVVYDGQGFSEGFSAYLTSTGKAIRFSDLETYLKLFFNLPI